MGKQRATRSGLSQPVAFSCFVCTTPLFSPNSYLFHGLENTGQIGWFLFPMFAAALVVALVVALASSKRKGASTPVAGRGARVVAALAYTAATLVCALLAADAAFPRPVAVGAGLACGAAIVFVLGAWGQRFAELDYRSALLASCVLCVASALLSLALYAIPFPARLLAEAALVAVGSLAPAGAGQQTTGAPTAAPGPADDEDAPRGTAAELAYTLRLPALSVFMYAFVMSVNKVYAFGFVDGEYVGGIVAALCLMPLLSVRSDAPLSSLVGHIAMPVATGVMAVFCALCAYSQPDALPVFGVYVCMSASALMASAQFVAALHAKEFSADFISSSAVALWCVVSLAGLVWVRFVDPGADPMPLIVFMALLYCAAMLVTLGVDSWRASRASAADDEGDGEAGLAAMRVDAATLAKLSQREAEVFPYLARGHSIAYIAEQLFISESTVRSHVKHIYAKLGVHSREELFALVDHTGASHNS